MVNLFNSFSNIKSKKVLVVGDFMLDTYTMGRVRRISPEAPVAVLRVEQEEQRPGGAGNVALNLISMGADVITLGRIGGDEKGKVLTESLGVEGIETGGLVIQDAYPTPVKNRVIADNQQIVRVDWEQTPPLPEHLEQQVIEKLDFLVQDVNLVAISDYGKGFITATLMAAIVERAKKRGIPIVVDPKGVDFTKYRGVDFIKPNLSEVYAAANLPLEASLDLAASRVLEASQAAALMVTRSEAGISIFYRDGSRQDFPVSIREVMDVTGAGDTVLAMLSTALANNLSIEEGAQLSNRAAGLAVERFGCARITMADLARCLLKEDVGNKVFDEAHLSAMEAAMKERRFAVLILSGEQGFTTEVFSAIRLLSKEKARDLVILVEGVTPQDPFVNILASLKEVDAVIPNKDTLDRLCQKNTPDECFAFVDDSLVSVLPGSAGSITT